MELAIRCSDGEVVECDHLAFGTGDLVEVYAMFEIAEVTKKRRDKSIKVHLSFNSVVRLMTAQEVSILIDKLATHLTCLYSRYNTVLEINRKLVHGS